MFTHKASPPRRYHHLLTLQQHLARLYKILFLKREKEMTMKKLLLPLVFVSSIVAHEPPTMLHEHSVDISYTTTGGQTQKATIARDSDLRCRQIPFNAREYWDGSYASKDVDEVCKKAFITAAGKLSPMIMHEDIETFGELEVLEFLEDMQDDKERLFVDSRKPGWYESLTIPSAINIPFTYFTQRDKWEKEKKEALVLFGVKVKKPRMTSLKPKRFCSSVTVSGADSHRR